MVFGSATVRFSHLLHSDRERRKSRREFSNRLSMLHSYFWQLITFAGGARAIMYINLNVCCEKHVDVNLITYWASRWCAIPESCPECLRFRSSRRVSLRPSNMTWSYCSAATIKTSFIFLIFQTIKKCEKCSKGNAEPSTIKTPKNYFFLSSGGNN